MPRGSKDASEYDPEYNPTLHGDELPQAQGRLGDGYDSLFGSGDPEGDLGHPDLHYSAWSRDRGLFNDRRFK